LIISPPAAFRLTRPTPPEAAVLAEVLGALRQHRDVGWVARMNTGAYVIGTGSKRRFVQYGFKGLSDIIGQLRDGRFLAVEVKQPGGKPTTEQLEFLARVRRYGGVAGVVERVADALTLVEGEVLTTRYSSP